MTSPLDNIDFYLLDDKVWLTVRSPLPLDGSSVELLYVVGHQERPVLVTKRMAADVPYEVEQWYRGEL